jgi:hypothetical protein
MLCMRYTHIIRLLRVFKQFYNFFQKKKKNKIKLFLKLSSFVVQRNYGSDLRTTKMVTFSFQTNKYAQIIVHYLKDYTYFTTSNVR